MGKEIHRRVRSWRLVRSRPTIAASLCILLIGCASPGQPKPPSLRLSQVVTDLSAQRVGDRVHLRWTTPSVTTDNLAVPAHVVAVICRQEIAPPALRRPCQPVQRLPVTPGPREVDDVLPPALTVGPVDLLAYRIELLNAEGRSAGRSAESFAARGAVPATVEELVATPIRLAIRLQWRAQPGEAAVELDRVDGAKAAAATQGKGRKLPLLAPASAPAEVRLSAKEADQPDRGGTIDRSAEKGATYSYTAQRVQTAVIEGHRVSIRSMPSAKVTAKVLNTLPPMPPAGLQAAPGGAETPTIDLSWEPGAESDLAGYNVYREEIGPNGSTTGAWHRLNPATIPAPSFQDSTVHAGTRYVYRVTAVDSDGNESAAGNEVQETPGTR